jgi:arginase family enzyme
MANDILPLDKNQLKELLNKGWMTHDAMWFYNCLEECGIEKTNKINQGAIRSLGPIEIKRYQKALGFNRIESHDDLVHF